MPLKVFFERACILRLGKESSANLFAFVLGNVKDIYYIFKFVCVSVCVHVTDTWRSEGCLWELVFSFHRVGLGDGAHVSGLAAGAFTG